MERKYKQRGYMEESGDSDRRDRSAPRQKPSGIKHFGMRNGGTARSGVRCARCGKTIPTIIEVAMDSTCQNCGADLHTCTNCSFFKSTARWECTKPILARIEKKDLRNDCSFFSQAIFVERTFESAETAPQDARKAFDALFKK
jgi:hypothetical protein